MESDAAVIRPVPINRELPAGSYTQSCDGIRIDGDDLNAHCQTRDGGSRRRKLDDFQKCKSDIINDDGNLHCEQYENNLKIAQSTN